MSILIGPDTRLLVQGITGREGEFHARAMHQYGTPIVAGVTPGKGGQLALDGAVPVFDTVADAVRETGASSAKDMGKVMKAVMAKLAGQNVDGKTVNELVRQKLASG